MLTRILVAAAAVAFVLVGLSVAHAIVISAPTPNVVTQSPSYSPALPLTPATPDPSPSPTPYSGPVAMTVNATATMPWSPTLDPSNFTDVFQLVDPAHGYLATGGTQYLVAHAYEKGTGAPGNTWAALKVGDVVSHQGAFYRVTRISTPPKGDIAQEPIWFNDPNLLVLITCLARGAGVGLATNNNVIELETMS
jgi:hypothetical protein